MWLEPVPKLSSPHIWIKFASIKFPKNFQPVGVSNNFNPNLAATLSMAPEVGIDLATPVNGELRKHSEFEARIAKESEGVTKKLFLYSFTYFPGSCSDLRHRHKQLQNQEILN